MAHTVRQWPDDVYPDEVRRECPEAEAAIDAFILELQSEGPSPAGAAVKALGKRVGGLWQANLRVKKRQVRILYAPYGEDIVLFHIHKKSSPQEQQRAYRTAMRRKDEYEAALRSGQKAANV